MVLRLLIRLLASNEQLVQKLSESYPVRRAAQILVRTVYRGKYFMEEKGWDKKITPEQFKTLMSSVANNFKNQIKQTQDELKKRMK